MENGAVFFHDRLGRKQRVPVEWSLPAPARAAA